MIKVTLIRPKGCAHCSVVKPILQELKKDFSSLKVEEIDLDSAKGQALVKKYNIMASPGILINNKFFAMGGATKEQFRKKFELLNKGARSIFD